ncbi:MAG TPA: serine/threonine-protein kinase, partial [Urbifossiella sp.]|nr:serine/threonine-protein kinase [Urbifossiella sp.]
GAVYLAEQERPVRRKVALKIIKPGMDTAQVVARFEAERQALALMDHPNIAKVLDAGSTAGGRPFFVMELVRGVPITDFCDRDRLPPRDRLGLFVRVCQAVQHAHQKGVIHRDVKPSNVLVALYDDRPVPKVIDFGVAKAAGDPLTDRTLVTGFGAVIGTPQYMAPEQATLNNLDIDTRADVYGLGALLYELLTGSPPFAPADLRRAGLLEVLRVIREQEPPRPSTRVSSSAARPSIAAARGTEPGRLTGLLRSDLDWVVMKALEKDRGRRYDTAAGFAGDVERYLAGEPVQAAPPSSVYRLRKFVRRHRARVGVAAVLVIALVAGTVGTTIGLVRAGREAAAARRAAHQARTLTGLLKTFLESADPYTAKGPAYTVKDLLDDHAPTLGAGLEDQPEVEAELRATVGRAYLNLSQTDLAVAQFERAVVLDRALLPPDDPRLAGALTDLAYALAVTPTDRTFSTDEHKARVARGRAASAEAVGILRGRGGEPAELFARALVNHGEVNWARWAETDNDPAAAAVREGLEVARRCPGPEARRLAAHATELLASDAQFFRKDHAAAVRLAREAVGLWREACGDHHPATAEARMTLGQMHLEANEHRLAEEQFRPAFDTFRRTLTDRPSGLTGSALRGLVTALAVQFKDEEIAAVLDGLPADWRARSFRFPFGAQAGYWWGFLCYTRGDYPDAERHLREVLAIRRAGDTGAAGPVLFPDEVERDARFILAVSLAFQDRPLAAREAVREWLPEAYAAAAGGPATASARGLAPAVFLTQVLLIAALTGPDDPAHNPDLQKAVNLTAARLRVQDQLLPGERIDTLFVDLLVRHRTPDRQPADEEYEQWLANLGPWMMDVRRVLTGNRADALERRGDPRAGDPWREAAVYYAARLPGHPEVAHYRTAYADYLTRQNRPAEAAGELEAAYDLLTSHEQSKGASLSRRRAEVTDRLIRLASDQSDEGKARHWRAVRQQLPYDPVPPPRPVVP